LFNDLELPTQSLSMVVQGNDPILKMMRARILQFNQEDMEGKIVEVKPNYQQGTDEHPSTSTSMPSWKKSWKK